MSLDAFLDWFTAEPAALLGAAVSAVAIYLVVLVFTRINGVRTFRKSSAFDFAATIATGSMMATIVLSRETPLAQGLVGLLALLVVQRIVSHVRMAKGAADVIDNDPVLLMAGSDYIRDNMKRTRISENDIRAQLRLANVLDPSHIHAVVLETTGDISVLHGEPERVLDLDLLQAVVGVEHLHRRRGG